MRFDAVIELVSPGGYTQDDIGQQVAVAPTSREVYANEFSVSSREYYDAGATGMKPERRYEVRSIDYEGEQLVRVDGIAFDVVRVERKGEWTRLTLERVAGDG